MKEILNGISMLEGFMSTEEVKNTVFDAELRNLDPGQVAPYNGPEEPGEPGDLNCW